jgi:hypothetical protein
MGSTRVTQIGQLVAYMTNVSARSHVVSLLDICPTA